MHYKDDKEGLLKAVEAVQDIMSHGRNDVVSAIIVLATSDADDPVFASYHANTEALGRMIIQLLHKCIGVPLEIAQDIAAAVVELSEQDTGGIASEITTQLIKREMAQILGRDADAIEPEGDEPDDKAEEG